MYMLFVPIGKNLVIISATTFKVAAWQVSGLKI